MKLKEAREILKSLKSLNDFLFLKKFIHDEHDPIMTNTDETTQASMHLMNQIRNSRLFTMPSLGDVMQLTQRDTNLCVAIAAMRLLSYAFIAFLAENIKQEKRQELATLCDEIISFPKTDSKKEDKKNESDMNPSMDPMAMVLMERDAAAENQDKKDKPTFLQKLLAICCGVISPKSLNGLNHCNIDNDFQTANQEQNIRDLLERLCYATEFQIEGWKKIVPLIKILNDYTNVPVSSLKLKMEEMYAFNEPVDGKFNENDCMGKTIKTSRIYKHFTNDKTKNQKLVIYVSQTVPINENYLNLNMNWAGQHCVVAKEIKHIKIGKDDVECLVLENTGRNKELNYIPVDFPFFEEIPSEIQKIEIDYENNRKLLKSQLNKKGYEYAQKKWKKLEKKQDSEHWFNIKKDGENTYQLFFVKASAPIYKLKFHS